MFEHSMPNDSLVIVHRLKAWIAVSLAVLWLPVANHCRLEAFPILDFLACCDHEEQAPHEDEDCEGDFHRGATSSPRIL